MPAPRQYAPVAPLWFDNLSEAYAAGERVEAADPTIASIVEDRKQQLGGPVLHRVSFFPVAAA